MKRKNDNHYFYVYQAIGKQIIINTYSSALLVLCKGPFCRKSKRVKESMKNLELIKDKKIESIARYFSLDVDTFHLESLFFRKTKEIKEKYAN